MGVQDRDGKRTMRRMLMAGLIVLFAFGTPAVADAQSTNPPGLAQVQAILASYPNGGPGLQQAIAAAVEANPSLAAAVAFAAQSATVLQQQAMGLGLAEAAADLRQSGNIAAVQQIQQAAASGPPALQASFSIASGTTASPIAGGSTGTSNLVTSRCVSPSAPAARCSP